MHQRLLACPTWQKLILLSSIGVGVSLWEDPAGPFKVFHWREMWTLSIVNGGTCAIWFVKRTFCAMPKEDEVTFVRNMNISLYLHDDGTKYTKEVSVPTRILMFSPHFRLPFIKSPTKVERGWTSALLAASLSPVAIQRQLAPQQCGQWVLPVPRRRARVPLPSPPAGTNQSAHIPSRAISTCSRRHPLCCARHPLPICAALLALLINGCHTGVSANTGKSVLCWRAIWEFFYGFRP